MTHSKSNPNDKTLAQICSTCFRAGAACTCKKPSGKHQAKTESATVHGPGELIAGKYQIIRVLGVGAMATVYLARHALCDELFALKMLNKEIIDNEEAKARFDREAKAISKLAHPNIVSLHDYGRTTQGNPYFVMDYLEGVSLLDMLSREKLLEQKRAVPFFRQISEAMAHAHAAGVVHRDLKPSNIVLVRKSDSAGSLTEQARVVDFGIAKIVHSWEENEAKLTQDGEAIGSPAYMSPEQCRGIDLDHRSDIYSLGCIMYEALCGVRPFDAEYALAILVKQVTEAAPPMISRNGRAAFSNDVENIVMKCLEKDPTLRYQSMEELKRDLQKIS